MTGTSRCCSSGNNKKNRGGRRRNSVVAFVRVARSSAPNVEGTCFMSRWSSNESFSHINPSEAVVSFFIFVVGSFSRYFLLLLLLLLLLFGGFVVAVVVTAVTLVQEGG